MSLIQKIKGLFTRNPGNPTPSEVPDDSQDVNPINQTTAIRQPYLDFVNNLSTDDEMGTANDFILPGVYGGSGTIMKPNPASLEDMPNPVYKVKTLDQLKVALASQESGGNYGAIGTETKYGKALGKYQILPMHLPEIGLTTSNADQQKFLKNPKLQDKLFNKMIDSAYTTYNGDLAKVAAHHYGGSGAAEIVNTPAGDRAQKGGPSINQYVADVLSR